MGGDTKTGELKATVHHYDTSTRQSQALSIATLGIMVVATGQLNDGNEQVAELPNSLQIKVFSPNVDKDKS